MSAVAQPRADPIRVMICDDSATVRSVLRRMLADAPDLALVAEAGDGEAALAKLADVSVDVLILDVAMPVMDGLVALPLLLRARPSLRVLVASTLTVQGADTTLEALRLGAAEWIAKPSAAGIGRAEAFRDELLAKIRALGRRTAPPRAFVAPPAGAPGRTPLLLAIGASTGGPQALFALLRGVGPDLPVPIVLTQHMPAAFTATLAAHLSRLGGLPCGEAVHGEKLVPGRVHLAPGGRHLLVCGGKDGLSAALSDAPPENFCRPAVDPMLRSAAVASGGRMLAVILTGMGQDGLVGTRAVVAAGGRALAQDEASSVVWGMPGAVAQAGLCDAVLPLDRIAAAIRQRFGRAA